MIEPRVRIVSDGTGYGTRIQVDGVDIPACEVRWSVAAGSSAGVATATVVIPNVALDVEAHEVVREIPTVPSQTVTEVTRVALHPGDRITYRPDQPVTPAQAAAIRDHLMGQFPEHDVVVVVGGTITTASGSDR